MAFLDIFRAKRSDPALSLDTWMSMFSFAFQGTSYTLPGATQEEIGSSYQSLARGAYKGNGVVFACIANRADLFTEARFTQRRIRGGRPGDLVRFRDDDLGLLDRPWEGGTTGDLLAHMILHHDIAGNAYVVRRPGRLTPLRPDWVTIIGGVPDDRESTVWHPDARVLGYAYQEGGPSLGKDPEFFLAGEVAHFALRRDPEARFRGMSWLTPIVREVMADKAMNDHKLAFLENGATPNLAVKLDVDDLKTFQDWIQEFKDNHEGVRNAYKTMFLAAGADTTVIGTDLKQLDFKITQGAGETRIAAAAGVPPVIVGLSEGLAAATYSNYSQARRRFADQTMRPLWRNVCGSLSQIIRVPSDMELWYDDRDIKALQEDQKDAAEIQSTRALTLKALLDAGFEADSAIAAVNADDFTLLQHSGLFSVQLQPPGTTLGAPPADAAPPSAPPRALEPPQPDEFERELAMLLREQPQLPPGLVIDVHTPDVRVEAPQITVEAPAAPEVYVEMPEIRVEAPSVTVEPARIEDGAITVNVEAPPAPNVTVERGGKRRVDFGDGRKATVTEGDVKEVVFDDGQTVTVTDLPDDEEPETEA